MASITAHPRETVLEAPAVEVIVELPLDIPWQGRALCRQMGLEHGVVFLDKLVKEGLFRSVARVSSRAAARTGFAAPGNGNMIASLRFPLALQTSRRTELPASVSPASER